MRQRSVSHPSFRVIARKTRKRVKLYSRPGNAVTQFRLDPDMLLPLTMGSCE
jgi:ATP-dependent DNA ligase